MQPTTHRRFSRPLLWTALAAAAMLLAGPAVADETCQSPYMAKLTSQEDFVYVWTVGREGMGDGSDKLVTIDARPGSKSYGEVIHSASVGGRYEAHHGGLTDDRRYFWGGGLDGSDIFVFDVHTDPAKPRLVKTIDDFVAESGGAAGPHGHYALPGRMLIAALSNEDGSGQTALVEYNNAGEHVATHWIPTSTEPNGAANGAAADGYGYDARVLPRRNVMLTSSFAGSENYMRPIGELLADAEAMKRFGNTVVVWDLHAREPKKVLEVPGAPLEIRFAWGPRHDYAFVTTALTSKLWLVYADDSGEWQAQAVATIGDPAQTPLPVDISLSSDDSRLWVSTFTDGVARLFDVSDPFHPEQIYEKKIGSQVNMISQTWNGERIYFSSSLLSKWDKSGEGDEQFVKAYRWDGAKLVPEFEVDFNAEKLGRPHLMRFGAYALYNGGAERPATARPAR